MHNRNIDKMVFCLHVINLFHKYGVGSGILKQ